MSVFRTLSAGTIATAAIIGGSMIFATSLPAVAAEPAAVTEQLVVPAGTFGAVATWADLYASGDADARSVYVGDDLATGSVTAIKLEQATIQQSADLTCLSAVITVSFPVTTTPDGVQLGGGVQEPVSLVVTKNADGTSVVTAASDDLKPATCGTPAC